MKWKDASVEVAVGLFFGFRFFGGFVISISWWSGSFDFWKSAARKTHKVLNVCVGFATAAGGIYWTRIFGWQGGINFPYLKVGANRSQYYAVVGMPHTASITMGEVMEESGWARGHDIGGSFSFPVAPMVTTYVGVAIFSQYFKRVVGFLLSPLKKIYREFIRNV